MRTILANMTTITAIKATFIASTVMNCHYELSERLLNSDDFAKIDGVHEVQVPMLLVL